MNFFSGSNNFLTQKVFRPKKNFYPTSVQVLHQHEITKGFRLIKKGESPLLFLHSLLRRFPSNMKAKKRVIIYDLYQLLSKEVDNFWTKTFFNQIFFGNFLDNDFWPPPLVEMDQKIYADCRQGSLT